MPSFFMPIGGSRKMGAWCKHNILWFFLNKNKKWTKCRLISKKSVLYRDCSHEDSPSLNGNLSFLTQFLLLPLKFAPFLWRHMASAECYCGSPRPHNAVQVRRMPPSVYSCSQVAKAADFDSVIGCSNQPSCAKKISMKGGCRNAQR